MREPPSKPQAPSVRTRPARRPPPALSKSLGPHLARLARASGAMDPRLAAEWASIAGPEISSLCRPVRIINRGRTQALEVSVQNGSAAMKLNYHQEALLARVRQRIGLPRLTRLVIREGTQARSWQNRRMAPAGPEPAPAPAKAEGLRAALEAMRHTIHERGD